MANVMKKDGNQTQQNPQSHGDQPHGERGELVRNDPSQQLMRDPFQMFLRDPFQVMREMMINPFRLFRSGMGGGRDLTWNADFEVRETEDAFLFKADMPGIKPNDLDISLSGNQLQIAGKREREHEHEHEHEGQFHTYERSYGSFTRTFLLPESADLDKITSELKDGVLSLVVPKKPGSAPQRRKIQIGAGPKS